MLAQECMKSGDPEQVAIARRLVPFMVHASNRVTDPEELFFFGMFAGTLGDKRVVPRLIELLKMGGDAAEGAKAGLSLLTLIPEEEVTAEKAQDWWARYHSANDSEIFGEQLSARDAMVRLAACRRLYPEQDSRIVPTLIDILKKHSSGAQKHGSVDLLKQITGSDWDLSEDQPPEQWKTRIERLEAWWKENGKTFIFMEFRDQMNQASGPVAKPDFSKSWLNDLSSLDQEAARAAYDGLMRMGDEAVPMLIENLDNQIV